MTRFNHALAAALVVGAAFTLEARAAGATATDVQAQVTAAADHFKKVGKDKAVADFNSAPEWKAKGMNIIVDEASGLVLASSMNEKLRGKVTLESRDPNGKEYVKEFLSVAKKGGGWVDYQFLNPESKQVETRTMYVRPVSGFDGFIGAAISKQ